jgi:hypothetical protein
LGEHGATRVHQPSPSAAMQKYGLLQKLFSNRLQPFLPVNLLHALIYNYLPVKRWDSSDKFFNFMSFEFFVVKDFFYDSHMVSIPALPADRRFDEPQEK